MYHEYFVSSARRATLPRGDRCGRSPSFVFPFNLGVKDGEFRRVCTDLDIRLPSVIPFMRNHVPDDAYAF